MYSETALRDKWWQTARRRSSADSLLITSSFPQQFLLMQCASWHFPQSTSSFPEH